MPNSSEGVGLVVVVVMLPLAQLPFDDGKALPLMGPCARHWLCVHCPTGVLPTVLKGLCISSRMRGGDIES